MTETLAITVTTDIFNRPASLEGLSAFLKAHGETDAKKAFCAFYDDLYTAVTKRLGNVQAAVRCNLSMMGLSSAEISFILERLRICTAGAALCSGALAGAAKPNPENWKSQRGSVADAMKQHGDSTPAVLLGSMAAALKLFENRTPEENALIEAADSLTQAGDQVTAEIAELESRVSDHSLEFCRKFAPLFLPLDLSIITGLIHYGVRLYEVTTDSPKRVKRFKSLFNLTREEWEEFTLAMELLDDMSLGLRIYMLEHNIKPKCLAPMNPEELLQKSSYYADRIIAALSRVEGAERNGAEDAFTAFSYFCKMFSQVPPHQTAQLMALFPDQYKTTFVVALNALDDVGERCYQEDF